MKPYEHQIALAKLKRKYPHLAKDTVHTWRAKTDIELVHKEPTKSEQIRIWRNWNKMPDAMKRKSDAKSKKLYSMTNEEHHRKLMKKTAYQLGYEQTFEKLAINFKTLKDVSSRLFKQKGIRGARGFLPGRASGQRMVGITHTSPDVLMQEGNLLSSTRRDIPGSEKALQAMDILRTDPGIQNIREFYPGYQHGTTRLSRHARKRIGESIRGTSTQKIRNRTMSDMGLGPRVWEDPGDVFRRRPNQLPKNTVSVGPEMIGDPGQSGRIVSGGSTAQAIKPKLPENMTGFDKELLNRVGIMHEGMEGDAMRKVRGSADLVEGWGKMPYLKTPAPSVVTESTLVAPEEVPDWIREVLERQKKRGRTPDME